MPMLELGHEHLFYALHPTRPDRAGDGPVLVLLHGAGSSHLVWPAELRHIKGVTVYALDLPAHGRSQGRARAAIGDYAGVVASFVEARRLERIVLVGHSMGGAIALQMALEHPTNLVGLALVASGARLRVATAILSGLLADYQGSVNSLMGMMWGAGAPPALVDTAREQMLNTPSHVTHADFSACDAFDVSARLGQVAVPTLVIGGTDDQLTPPKYAARLAEGIPNAHLCLIEQAGHMVMLERAEAVAQAVGEFLRSQSG